MKKTMSRLLAVALVLAMVCAMIPAAMAAVAGVTIGAPTKPTMTVGEKQTLTATVTLDAGDTTTVTSVTWSVSGSDSSVTSTDVISVNASTGEVTALKAGTAYVIATSTADSTKSANVSLTVQNAPEKCCAVVGCTCTDQSASATTCDCAACTALTGINLTAPALNDLNTKIEAKKTKKLNASNLAVTATVACTKATAPTVALKDVTIASDDVTKATVTPGGTAEAPEWTVTAVAAGSTTLTVTYRGKTQTIPVVVSDTLNYTTLSFTTNPVSSATYVQNATATALTVATTGGYEGVTTTYQWYMATSASAAGTPISGQNSTSYTPDTKTTLGTTYYYCVATSTDGVTPKTAESTRAAITVTPQTYTLTLTVSPSTIKIDGSATLTATVKTTAGASYAGTETVTFSKASGTSYVTLGATSKALSGGTATTTVTGSSKGTSTIKASVTIGGQIYTDTVTVTVSGVVSAETINYESDSDGYAYFDGNDFYKKVKNASGSTLSYVKFTSQYGGTLYKDKDSTSSSNKVTASTLCYYEPSSSSRVDLDDLVFIINDSYSKHYVDYTAYTSSGTEIATGRVTIDGDGSSDGDVTYYVSSEETVSLDEDDFQSFFEDEYSKGTLDYVKFAIGDATNYGTSSYGHLYESGETKASKVSSSSKYYYEATSKQDDLDTVEFRAGTRSSAYTVKVPFTAYGKDKNDKSRNVDGTLVIEVNNTKFVTITTDGDTFTNLKLVKSLQPKNVSSSKLDNYYVMFDKVTNGTLYSYYKTASNSEEYGKRDKYWFNPDSDEYDLGDVFFLPKSNAKTAEISYTLYKTTGSSKKNGTEVDTGKILFKVEQAKVTVTFNDIPANVRSWAGDAIEYMAKEGYITGTGAKKFSPNTNMSRAMLVTVLYRMAGEPSVSGIANPFTDVVRGQYYYNAVLWAYNKGIVTGKGANKFAPNDNVSREEIATFLYRYASKPAATGTLTGFSDYTKVSAYATDAMKWAVKNEIVAGIGGKLSPKTSATRAQVATMLYRYINK